MSYFNVFLENLVVVRTPRVVENVIRNVLGPIAQAANRPLRFVSNSHISDISLYFHSGMPMGPLILGNEGGGEVFVGACANLRVGGSNPRTRDQLVFTRNTVEFGRFIGNVAVHELGHQMASLEHVSYRHNFMHSGTPIPAHQRSIQSMQQHWAGRFSFNASQTRRLREAIRTNNFTGGIQFG